MGYAQDAMFCHPRGLFGLVGAWRLARENAWSERWAAEQVDPERDRRILVVGPGPGVGLPLVARFGEVVAIEPSRLMRRLASLRVRSGDVVIRPGRAEDTGCANASIDLVIGVNNVMLWDRPVAFAELRRVLVPNGRLVLVEHQHGHPDRAEHLAARLRDARYTVDSLTVEQGAIRLIATRDQ